MSSSQYEAVEAHDSAMLAKWLTGRDLQLRPFPQFKDRSLKRPDFQVAQADEVIGFCELKSFGLGPWDITNAAPCGNGVVEFQASDALRQPAERDCDRIIVRLSRSFVGAARQCESVDPEHRLLWIVAIANHDPVADVEDLNAMLRGHWRRIAGSYWEEFYDEKRNPEFERVSRYRRIVDAVIWLDGTNVVPKLNDLEPTHFDRLKSLLLSPVTSP